jgi:hypothetical protein
MTALYDFWVTSRVDAGWSWDRETPSLTQELELCRKFTCELEDACERACEHEYTNLDGWEWMDNLEEVCVLVAPHGQEGPPEAHAVSLCWDISFCHCRMVVRKSRTKT